MTNECQTGGRSYIWSQQCHCGRPHFHTEVGRSIFLSFKICSFVLSPFPHFLNTRREGMPLMPESPTASKSEKSNFEENIFPVENSEETIFQLKTYSMVGTQRQSQHFSVLRVMTDKLFCQHIFWQKLEVWREYGKNTILIRFNRATSLDTFPLAHRQLFNQS